MATLMQDLRLKLIRDQIPALARTTDITALGGGLTNMNYRVDTKDGVYVMRVSDNTTGILGINRENEKVNTERANNAGIGPAVIDYLPSENVLVLSWINARTLHREDLHHHPGLLNRIAGALRNLHGGPAFAGDFYFPAIRNRYREIVLKNNYFIPAGYLNVEPMICQLEKLLEAIPEERVPCNNDLLPENFLDDGEKIWIIDYEYAGQNEPSFEIGNLAGEAALSNQQITTLCDAYWLRHLPSKIARARAWSMIARYGWVLWASIQEAVSSISFDFRTWGINKWNSVLPEITGDDYQVVLTELKKFNA